MGGKALCGVPNTRLPLIKAFMMKLVTEGKRWEIKYTRKMKNEQNPPKEMRE